MKTTQNNPATDFLLLISAPAKRALVNNGISTLQQLAQYSESDILKFHGMGPSSIPKLRAALAAKGLKFKL